MKDPLQVAPAEDEILGIAGEATDAAVKSAFARLLPAARGQELKRLMAAQKFLRDPVNRAVLVGFRYRDPWLVPLDPSPLADPGCLAVERRLQTAQAWERALSRCPTETRLSHALGLLWYWWARARGDGPPLADRWFAAIAYLGSLAADAAFWHTLADGNPVDAREVGDKVAARLRSDIGNAQLDAPDAFRELDAALTTEVRSARALVDTSAGPDGVTAGVLLLTRLGLVEVVRARLAGRGGEPAGWLLTQLSPRAPVAALLDAGRYDEALAALDALPADQAEEPDARRLRLRALRERASNLAGMGDVPGAIDAYGAALPYAGDAEASVREAVVTLCLSAAQAPETSVAAMDAVIGVLERGHKVVRDPRVAAILADRLTTRGIRVCVEAQEAMNAAGEVTAATKKRFRAGVKDLKRAASLGSKRAREQADAANAFLKQVESGMVGLSDEVERLLSEANQAAGAENWDTAIDCLRRAAAKAPATAQPQLKKNLAVCLANRAGRTASAAMSAQQAGFLLGAGPASIEDGLRAVAEQERQEEKARLKARPFAKKVVDAALFPIKVLISNAFYAFFLLLALLSWLSDQTGKQPGGWRRTLVQTGTAIVAVAFLIVVGTLIWAVISLVKDWFNKITAMDPYRRAQSSPPEKPCWVCGSESAYGLRADAGRLAGKTSSGKTVDVGLCYSHKNTLEQRMNAPSTAVTSLLRTAEKDMAEAAGLDPSNRRIAQELEALRSILSRA